MPPKFRESSFRFAEGESVPDHVEGYPDPNERDHGMFWLEGEDTFEGEYYPLAIDIGDFNAARALQLARLRLLEIEQPTALSGGQTVDGIQDAVHIRIPGYERK